jgi:hypothetical protein
VTIGADDDEGEILRTRPWSLRNPDVGSLVAGQLSVDS